MGSECLRAGLLHRGRYGRPEALLHCRLVLLAVVWGLPLSCTGESAGGNTTHSAPSGRLQDLFELEARITLEERDSALITGVRDLAEGPEGRIALVDEQQSKFRVYSALGALLHQGGGFGSGPGELKRPTSIAWGPDEDLFVSDAGNARVSRYSLSFAFDTTWRVRRGYYIRELHEANDVLVTSTARGPGVPRDAHIYDFEGRLLNGFHEVAAQRDTMPYWLSAVGSRLAVSESYLVAGNSAQYPLALYDATTSLIDSVASPSPEWTPIPPTERGQFLPPNQLQRFEAWKRTFTSIDELEIVEDSVLVVVERDLEAEVLAYEVATYRAGIYDLSPPRRKLAAGVPLPGPVVAGGRFLWVLETSPPEGPWTLGKYRFGPREYLITREQ